MQRLGVRVLGVCLAILGGAGSALAQTTPRTEVSAGYQFLSSIDEDGESLPVGWYFDIAGNLNRTLGVVFQVGGNYKSFEESVTVGTGTLTADLDVKVHEFMGGLRVNARGNPALVPFGQVLVGGITTSLDATVSSTIPGVPPSFTDDGSATEFALQVGGGINFALTDALGLRVAADYLRIFADEGANVFRFHAGIAFGR